MYLSPALCLVLYQSQLEVGHKSSELPKQHMFLVVEEKLGQGAARSYKCTENTHAHLSTMNSINSVADVTTT